MQSSSSTIHDSHPDKLLNISKGGGISTYGSADGGGGANAMSISAIKEEQNTQYMNGTNSVIFEESE